MTYPNYKKSNRYKFGEMIRKFNEEKIKEIQEEMEDLLSIKKGTNNEWTSTRTSNE